MSTGSLCISSHTIIYLPACIYNSMGGKQGPTENVTYIGTDKYISKSAALTRMLASLMSRCTVGGVVLCKRPQPGQSVHKCQL